VGSHISTSAGDLHWKDYGGSGPVLVLVHGLGGSFVNWDAIGPRLAEDYRPVAFDLPGFGLSPPAADFEVRTLSRALAAFIREIGEPATLIGNSLGGLLSMMVAASEPDLVDNLVLISPAAPPRLNSSIHWPTARRVAIQATPGLGRLVTRRHIKKYEPRELIDLTLNAIMDNPSRVSMEMMQNFVAVAEVRRALPWTETAVPSTSNSIAKMFVRPSSFVAMVRDIRAPTLVLHGVNDRLVSAATIRWLCSLRPDWDLIELEDTGHVPQIDAPIRLLGHIGTWLANRHQSEITA
jgi:pimeloyl-ACP methyl ester carboxylesterase